MSLTADTEKAVFHSTHGIADAQGVDNTALKTHPSPDIKVDGKDDDKLSAELAAREAAIKKPFGEAWKDLRTSVGHFLTNLRHHAIGGTPRFIVNNSSNVLGAAHVATEVLMFKSSIPHKDLVHNPTGPIDYVTRAVKRVFGESLSGSQSDFAEISKATERHPVRGFINYIRDVDAATERAIALNVGKRDEDGKTITREKMRLGNPWQTRSTLAGLIVWSLSAIIPDKREKPEEVERMAIKRETNPLGYVAERLKQAIWFPEWDSHKRQMIGLGIMTSGVCSLIGSWRNNIKVEGLGLKYAFNGGYFATSMLTLISSIPLLFATDDQKGFGGFGAWMTGRLAFLPGSINRKFKGDKISAGYYTAAMASFQAENWAQALIGGAEKLPDGTIVDHEEVRRRAHEEAVAIRQERKKGVSRLDYDAAQPSAVVNNISNTALAMPERREAVLEAASAANV
jgi:hypothetical protein